MFSFNCVTYIFFNDGWNSCFYLTRLENHTSSTVVGLVYVTTRFTGSYWHYLSVNRRKALHVGIETDSYTVLTRDTPKRDRSTATRSYSRLQYTSVTGCHRATGGCLRSRCFRCPKYTPSTYISYCCRFSRGGKFTD